MPFLDYRHSSEPRSSALAEAVPAPCYSVAGLGLEPLLSYGHEQKILKWDSSILLLLLAQAGATAQPWAHPIPHRCHPAGLCLRSPAAGSWAPTAASASHLKEVHKLLVILQQNAESCHRQKPRKYVPKSTHLFFKTNLYLCWWCWQRAVAAPRLPSVIFSHVQRWSTDTPLPLQRRQHLQ